MPVKEDAVVVGLVSDSECAAHAQEGIAGASKVRGLQEGSEDVLSRGKRMLRSSRVSEMSEALRGGRHSGSAWELTAEGRMLRAWRGCGWRRARRMTWRGVEATARGVAAGRGEAREVEESREDGWV